MVLILILLLIVSFSASVEGVKSSQKNVADPDCRIPELTHKSCVVPDAEEIAKHPLGSRENPIKVYDPSGERTYLHRLRCADGNRPGFNRVGSTGEGPYGFILDLYLVDCSNSKGVGPIQVRLYFDMYHPDYIETNPPNGFQIEN